MATCLGLAIKAAQEAQTAAIAGSLTGRQNPNNGSAEARVDSRVSSFRRKALRACRRMSAIDSRASSRRHGNHMLGKIERQIPALLSGEHLLQHDL